MSYEIALYPRRPDQDWDEAIAAADTDDDVLAGDEDALRRGVTTFRVIESRLRQQLSGEIEAWFAEETGGDVYGELTASGSGIQVELFDRSAAVTFPLADEWQGDEEDRATLEREVRQAVQVVAEETGYTAYDPQTREAFDGTFAAPAAGPEPGEVSDATGPTGEGPAAAATEGAHPAGESPTTGQGEPDPAGPRRPDPSSLRRRGWVYLILGVVLVVFGIQRYSSGNGNAITVVLLVIGVLDLLGGAFLLALAGRAAENARLRGDSSGPAA